MTRAPARVVLAAAAALVSPLSAAASASHPEPVLELLHVGANVGGASGGHVALRVGEAVHHYQAVDGLLRLVRDDWDDFRFRYNVLENRPLRRASLPASAGELRRVADAFAAVRLAQGRAFADLDEAGADVATLEALRGRRPGVRIRGAGLLDPETTGARAGIALRSAVADALGPGFLARESGALEAALAESGGALRDPRGYRERLALREALVALAEARAASRAALLEWRDAPPLSSPERVALERRREALAGGVVALLASPRPDRGAALLVETARYHAVARSLAANRPWVVDPFPDAAPRLDRRATRARREELAVVAEIAAERTEMARRAFAARPDARRYARLEALVAHALEYAAGARGRPVRDGGETLVPSRGRVVPLLAGTVSDGAVAAALDEARARERRARERLRAAWSYDLVTANCVTELAHTWARASSRAPGAGAASGVGFVPFVFFERVAAALPAERVTAIPSFRARALARLRDREGSALAELRESNVLTSRLYRRRAVDGSFLLFSDARPALRPLAGVVNLGYAALDAALGLATAPFDRAARLARAGRGLLFSAPELAFVNLRKGSFDAASLRRARAALERFSAAPSPTTGP